MADVNILSNDVQYNEVGDLTTTKSLKAKMMYCILGDNNTLNGVEQARSVYAKATLAKELIENALQPLLDDGTCISFDIQAQVAEKGKIILIINAKADKQYEDEVLTYEI